MFVLCAAQGFAQAEVSGTVKDGNNAAIAGANITLQSNQSKAVVISDTNGAFRFTNVAPGDYQINVAANGFALQKIDVRLNANENKQIDIKLEIGSSEFVVTAELGSNVERDKIPTPINRVDSEQILQRATSVLAQVGKEEAGVNVQATSPTIGGIFVRGLAGKNVNVFVDGVRYSNSAQRGGINTFFNLNEPTNLQSVEILRGANGAQYGSDSLGGTVSLLTKSPNFSERAELHGEFNPSFTSANRSFGSSLLFSYGTNKLGGYVNLAARRVNTLRSADGLDSHAAVTRFLGLPSNILGNRLPDTGFTQYGGAFRLNYSPGATQQIIFTYQRNQQDGGKRYDQLLGGDGNLIAELRNLMLDFGYLRYLKQNFGFFDSASFTVSYNSQREERVNQGGQGNPLGTVTHQYERTTATGFSFFLDKNYRRTNFLVGGDYYFEKINSPAFTFNPANNTAFLSRPRIPDQARFINTGIFVQNSWELFADRLRVSGALRYGGASYRARQADSPLVSGNPLWRDDSLRVADLSGRIGAVARIVGDFRVAFN
jgi:outer membrane receptor protein involved in Fe transport